MQPYAVIGKSGTHQTAPPKPVIWTSKVHLDVHGQEIVQPKARILSSSDQSSISSKNPGEKPASGIEGTGAHLIDLNRQSLRGFKVGEGNGNLSTIKQSKGIIKTDSQFYDDPNSPQKQMRTIKEQEQLVQGNSNAEVQSFNEYAIRMQGAEQRASNQARFSYTRRLIKDIGNEETNQLTPYKMKPEKEETKYIFIQPSEEFVQVSIVRHLWRGLGDMERPKKYTNEVILTRKEERALRTQQSKVIKCPAMAESVFTLLGSMKPAPSNLQDQIAPAPQAQSRLSIGSQKHRHPIFTNTKVEHFDESSKFPNENSRGSGDNNIFKQDNNIYFKEMEQSQVYPMGHSLRRQLISPDHPVSPVKPQLQGSRSRQEHLSGNMSLGNKEESEGKKNTYHRKLIFEGSEQRNHPQAQVIKLKRDLSGSNKNIEGSKGQAHLGLGNEGFY